MKHKISNLGGIGLITDYQSEDLPENAWDMMSNIRCQRDHIGSFAGTNELTDLTTEGHYILSFPNPTTYQLLYPIDVNGDGNAEAIYSFAGTETDRTNITDYPTGYSAEGRWNGCTLHGFAILNNYIDSPQFWDGVSADFSTMIYSGSNSWDDVLGGGETYRAKVMRSHKNYLWAIGINDNGDMLPHTVHRSGPSIPGSMPTSWDYSSTTDRSIRNALADSPGICVDGLSLRDSFIIYKEDMVYRADDIGGVLQVDFNPVFKDRGLWAADCVVNIGGRHVCLGDGRLYVHDGFATEDILEGRNADILFDSINPDYYENTFLAHNLSKSEVWICYPTSMSQCDTALVWNYKYNTFYPRQLPNLRHMTTGLVSSTSDDSWEYETIQSWEYENILAWDDRLYSPIGDTLIGIGGKVYQFDSGKLEDGDVMDCYAQRSNLNIGNDDDWHMITAIYPRAHGEDFTIQIGSQAYIDAPVEWESAQTFTPGSDDKLDFRSSGPFHAIRIRSNQEVTWTLSGYTIHFEKEGQR